ncbi:hypothetical protein BJ508DRAFT_310383 [Ascobolus immersus RN42]|uniref:Uncharacterized protein n=1 Tax=Ascobolus immersus RN42 TaxID=1160509 RepID=A0A3N4HU60_ASCIM|nr:hypothetical protein BJ508DRAFT_310383 [Ascobolus immersus RN42]
MSGIGTAVLWAAGCMIDARALIMAQVLPPDLHNSVQSGRLSVGPLNRLYAPHSLAASIQFAEQVGKYYASFSILSAKLDDFRLLMPVNSNLSNLRCMLKENSAKFQIVPMVVATSDATTKRASVMLTVPYSLWNWYHIELGSLNRYFVDPLLVSLQPPAQILKSRELSAMWETVLSLLWSNADRFIAIE